MGISTTVQCMATIAVVAAANAGPAEGANASTEDSSLAAEKAASAGHAAAAWLISCAIEMEQAPTIAWAFFRDLGSSLMLSEARRGLCILCLALTVAFWLSVRILRAMLYRIAKGVIIDVLRDEQVSKLGIKGFVSGMVACNRDDMFQDSFVKVLWSDPCKESFQRACTELLIDEQFQTGTANLIRGLTGIDFLKDAVKTQIRDTLKDQNIHRALLEGSLEALKPKWMQQDREDDIPSTPKLGGQATRRKSTAGL